VVAGFTLASHADSASNGVSVDKLTVAALNYDTGYRDGIAHMIELMQEALRNLDEDDDNGQ
jgi:hypothetical protein